MDLRLGRRVSGKKGVECEFDCLRYGFMGIEEGAVEVEDGEGNHLEEGEVCVITSYEDMKQDL